MQRPRSRPASPRSRVTLLDRAYHRTHSWVTLWAGVLVWLGTHVGQPGDYHGLVVATVTSLCLQVVWLVVYLGHLWYSQKFGGLLALGVQAGFAAWIWVEALWGFERYAGHAAWTIHRATLLELLVGYGLSYIGVTLVVT